MNRSILIVIADFLLVSLLAFSSLDATKLGEAAASAQSQPRAAVDSPNENADLVDMLKGALEEEKRARQQLVGALSQSQQTALGQQNVAAEREKESQAYRQALQRKEELARELESQKQALQSQVDMSRTNLQVAQRQLDAALAGARSAQQKLASTEVELRKQQEQAAAAQRQAEQLARERAALDTEKKQLAQQLQSAETEKSQARQQLVTMQGEVQAERREKERLLQHADKLTEGISSLAQTQEKLASTVTQGNEKLAAAVTQNSDRIATTVAQNSERIATTVAQNSDRITTAVAQNSDKISTTVAQSSAKISDKVNTLAKQSSDLTREVRDYRPLPPNVIFGEFASNRVHAAITGVTTGMLGFDRTRQRETEMILATDGLRTYAVCHVEDTPFTFGNPGTDWEKLTGVLGRFSTQTPIEKLSFYHLDPRLVLVPVTPAQVKSLGTKVYTLSKEPLRFQDALLIGAREGYYGECRFIIDLATPQYVKMDHSVVRGLFGKFNPSRGDLVFSKNGDLLGIMANSTYCIILHNFAPATTFTFGESVITQRTGAELSLLYRQIEQLPSKLR